MGDHEVDVLDGEACLAEGSTGRVDHHSNGSTEDLFAIHLDGTALLAFQDVGHAAIAAEIPAEEVSRVGGCLDDDGTRTVTEQDGIRPVVPVGDR